MANAATTESLSTIRDFIRWGASRFNAAGLVFGHGTDNAFDEAAYLVLYALHLAPSLPDDSYLGARLLPDETAAVETLLQRRLDERLPAAYLTGEAWFAGLSFYVDERVLVPRSPLAELIEQQFNPWLEAPAVTRILDMGTGSGCIAVACAYAFPEAQVDAVDIDPDALEVARLNVQRHGLEARVDVLQSDLFAALSGRVYDLVICNPPYVDAQAMAQLPAEYRHEPASALAGGEDGLDYAVRILAQVPRHLAGGGLLALEVGNSAPALRARLPELPFIWPEFSHGGHGIALIDAATLLTGVAKAHLTTASDGVAD